MPRLGAREVQDVVHACFGATVYSEYVARSPCCGPGTRQGGLVTVRVCTACIAWTPKPALQAL